MFLFAAFQSASAAGVKVAVVEEEKVGEEAQGVLLRLAFLPPFGAGLGISAGASE
jgi:hypothetical protein